MAIIVDLGSNETRPMDDMLPSVSLYAPGAGTPTLYFVIRQAAIEFCIKTRLWRHESTVTHDGASDMPVPTPDQSELIDIELVRFNGKPLMPRTANWMDHNMAGWREGELTGSPGCFSQLYPNTIRTVPAMAGEVKLSVWLQPSLDCIELPRFLIDQYRETIALGAMGRLLSMPNQPYTDERKALMALQGFAEQLDTLKNRAVYGQQRARVRTCPTYF